MTASPKPERDSESDDRLMASLDSRLTRHLLDNATREEQNSVAREGFFSRIITSVMLYFLMITLKLFSRFDRQRQVL